MVKQKSLYVRLLIIVIAPIMLLESVVAFLYMERHWNLVTRRLSEATGRNIAAVVDLYELKAFSNEAQLIEFACNRFGLSLAIMEPGDLPKGGQPKPFFDLLDRALSEEVAVHVRRPFWIDTVGQSRHFEVRVKLDRATLRFTAPRALAYASNSHIFLLWMVATSAVLIAVAILFLRSQLRSMRQGGDGAAGGGRGPQALHGRPASAP